MNGKPVVFLKPIFLRRPGICEDMFGGRDRLTIATVDGRNPAPRGMVKIL